MRRKCVNFRDCSDFAVSEIRDPYFAKDHSLAFMPVCPTCLREYLALPKSLGFFERPEMADTQIQTADVSLRFSGKSVEEYQRINYTRGLMGRAATVVANGVVFQSTDILVFSETVDAGNLFAAGKLGTFRYMPVDMSREPVMY